MFKFVFHSAHKVDEERLRLIKKFVKSVMLRETMFPSKSMLEYITEMNRLFPKTSENDLLHTTNSEGAYSQSPSYSTYGNRSSSSADSTSPESYPDCFTSPPSSELFNIRPETPVQSYGGAFPRKQRAIVGRKILGKSEHSQHSANRVSEHELCANRVSEHELNFGKAWADELSVTPPSVFEQKYQRRNYELFPSERAFEARTPNKNATILSPMTSNLSPTYSALSGMSRTASSPQPMQSFAFASPRFDSFSPSTYSGASSSKSDQIASSQLCTFCRKNGETPLVYMTHMVKEKIGGQNIVTCPILRSHVCSACGATGDNAHTITYCPVLRTSNNGKRLQSTTITLKNTRIKSNGRRRY